MTSNFRCRCQFLPGLKMVRQWGCLLVTRRSSSPSSESWNLCECVNVITTLFYPGLRKATTSHGKVLMCTQRLTYRWHRCSDSAPIPCLCLCMYLRWVCAAVSFIGRDGLVLCPHCLNLSKTNQFMNSFPGCSRRNNTGSGNLWGHQLANTSWHPVTYKVEDNHMKRDRFSFIPQWLC